MGYKNAATASACFGPVKKKLLASTSSVAGDGSPTPTPKASKVGKGKGKRTADVADVEDGSDDGEEVLSTKTQKPKKAKQNVEAEGEEDARAGVKVEDEGETSDSWATLA